MIATPAAIPILAPGAAFLARLAETAETTLELPPPPAKPETVADRLRAVLKPEEYRK